MPTGLGAAVSDGSDFHTAVAIMRDRITARVSAFLGRGTDASNPLRVRPAGGADRLFCAMVLILCALGVVMVFSAGAAFAAKRHADLGYFLNRELAYAGAGMIAFVLATHIDYGVYRRWSYPLLFLSIALLAGLLIAGTRVNGAVRWYRFGPLSFQPSELAKFALVLYLSLLLSRNAERVKAFSMGFLPPVLMTGVVVGLVIIQPDLGTSVIIGLAALMLLFISGTRTSYIAAAMLVTAPVVWKVLITGKAWRMQRLLAFLDPWQYCQTAGYQLCESLISIGSGGVWGQGLGQSRQKLFFLPEAHTDFILAIIGEELGLVGVLLIMAAFAVLIWRGLQASLRARDLFGSYLAFGITVLFAMQALANMGVVLGLLPTKGLALPFISYGGTSLIVSLFMAGVVANISARNPEPRPRPLWKLWERKAAGPTKNRRSPKGPRIVVELPGKAGSAMGPAAAGAAALAGEVDASADAGPTLEQPAYEAGELDDSDEREMEPDEELRAAADEADEDDEADAFEDDDEPSNPFADHVTAEEAALAEAAEDPERRTLGAELEPGSEIAQLEDRPRSRR
jgi:cell division protein FtsW